MGWPGCGQLPVEKWNGPWGVASFTLEPHKPLTDEDRKNADIYNSYASWVMDGSPSIRCIPQAQQMNITLISLMRKKLVPMEGITRQPFTGWNL